MTTSDDVTWQVIRDDDLSLRQKELLKSKNKTDAQREFLVNVAADDNSRFCRDVLAIGIEGAKLCDSMPEFSPSEFLEPPWESECALWAQLNELAPTNAAMPGFWARFCVQAVQEGRIHASTFAQVSRSSKDVNGKARIRRALAENNDKEMEACVRRIFRVMGGILSDRGHRTTFLDCPLGKCWWRHRIASHAAELLGCPEQIKEYSDALRPTHIWDTLLQHIVSRQTIIGFPKILAAIVDEIARMTQSETTNEARIRQELAIVGSQCANQALELLDIDSILSSLFGRGKWIVGVADTS